MTKRRKLRNKIVVVCLKFRIVSVFFLKKKIDLELFRQGDPNLFDEFASHYEVMSEKSFDHTKKYWFNNLRHIYPLSEVKEAALKQAVKGVPTGEKPENETVTSTVTTTPRGMSST